MEPSDERPETSGSDTSHDAKDVDSTLHIRTDDIETHADEPVLLTSRSANALGYLTADLILSRLGIYDLAATKELILRDEGLVGLQDECAQRLVALEIFSLSHNKLTTLQGFQYLTNLIELNLNFNRITSLDHLQCFGLEKLFLSNNRILDITPLKAFTKLTTLSVYGNLVSDLEASLSTCRALPKLRSLDLGGNPCSQEVDGYKFQVVRFLPRLKILDGDQLTQLDKDLADEFVMQGRPVTADTSRPSTATSIGSRPLTAASKPWETGAPPMTPSKSFDPFTSKHMPKGNVRLFRDDFLNNNPILLEYLAQEAQDVPHQSQVLDLDSCSDGPPSLHHNSGFVEKMRSANPLDNSNVDTTDDTDGISMDSSDAGRPATALSARPMTAGLSTGIGAVLTSNLGIDPSDPKSTIRKLLKHIELLEESLASYKTRQVEATELALLEENQRLQTENNNIPILQDEITSLKKQLSAASGPRPPAPASIGPVGADAKRLNALEQENEQLRRDVQRLKQMLKSQELAETESTHVSREVEGQRRANGVSDGTPAHTPKRLSDSALLEESAAMDVELTELILQNEVSLEMIRNDIKNTKREWEEQFQVAKQRELERQRVRPQTSLGLLHGTTDASDRTDKLRELGGIQKGRSSGVKNQAATTIRGRQIHTSAGFHHGAGPEERLLHDSQATHTAPKANGRSVTNILTL